MTSGRLGRYGPAGRELAGGRGTGVVVVHRDIASASTDCTMGPCATTADLGVFLEICAFKKETKIEKNKKKKNMLHRQ